MVTARKASDPLAEAFQNHKGDVLDILFDRVPVGIAVLDRDSRVLKYNPTWAGFVAQYTPQTAEILAPGVSLFSLAPGFEPDTRPLLSRVLLGEVVRRDGLRLEDNGVVSYWDVVLTPLIEEGEVIAIVLMTADATERVEAHRVMEQRVEERTRELEQHMHVAGGLRDILSVLNSNRPLQETLDYIASEAARLLGTESIAIFRLQHQEGVLVVQAACGLPSDYITEVAIPVGEAVVGKAVQERRPVAACDTESMFAALSQSPSIRISDPLRRQIARMTKLYGSVLSVPLIIKDEIYGGISLYYRERRSFSEEEIALAATFGDHVALAIENARLREQVGMAAVAAERSRLARDLHDSVTQTLFSASLIAEVLPRLWERDHDEARKRLQELRQLTRGALAEMRTLLVELRPAALTEVELGELLRQLAEATSGRSRAPVELTVEGQMKLPPDVQIAFYRIAQEALNNVAHHARARKSAVSLRFSPEQVELRVSDDGAGFDLKRVTPEHLGLKIMRERAEAIGARLNIRSRPGEGTLVTAAWPVQDEEAKV